jgi:LysM repeat protein
MSVSSAQEPKYLLHKLVTGETLSQLAVKYNTTVGSIMRLNRMNAQSKLVYGTTIKIPDTSVQVIDTTVPAKPVQPPLPEKPKILPPADGIVHIVKTGETLYSISRLYGTSVDAIKRLNQLDRNEILPGQTIVISEGRIIYTDTSEAVINNTNPDDTGTKENASRKKKTTRQKGNQVPTNGKSQDIKTIKQKPFEVVRKAPEGEGFFKSLFNPIGSIRQITGTGMAFKSESGWDDSYFFILIHDITPGSIVKLTYRDNHIIYAKVLMDLGSMKENESLSFRLSDAGVAALGITTEPFLLTIEY